ncbi:MAG: 37S ribosomal protein, mitochondrial [Caeruleum heppii]|nr:MAG: 37S ribosomal protein, mitochondrial [Caeruleum heppii]
MILRPSLVRPGRRVLSSLSHPSSSSPLRSLTSKADTLSASLDQETHATAELEESLNALSTESIPARPVDTDPPRDEVPLAYRARRKQKRLTDPLGTTITPHYQPHTLLSHPPPPSSITLPLLLASQTHLGHATSLWHPGNARHIFGIRQGIHIISLETTATHLRRACKIVTAVAQRGGVILFVGTRRGHEPIVIRAAARAAPGGCHVFERWRAGSITNAHQLLRKSSVTVVDQHDRLVPGFSAAQMDALRLRPDLVVVLNPLENYVLLKECGMSGIPTVGVVDTDCDPTWVTYPIPANDDSLRSVQLIAGVLSRAAEEGQARRRKDAEGGRVGYGPDLRIPVPARAREREELVYSRTY